MTIPIEIEDLKALLDIMTHTMDFGSGFLDTNEITLLRKLAIEIGMNPMEVTPQDAAVRIAHVYTDYDNVHPKNIGIHCKFCWKGIDDSPHTIRITAERIDSIESSSLD